jgi:hypothetical protein
VMKWRRYLRFMKESLPYPNGMPETINSIGHGHKPLLK